MAFGALTPDVFFDLKTNMRVISASEYENLTKDLWVWRVAKLMNSVSASERLYWLLDSAKIRREDVGSVTFEQMLVKSTEYLNEFAADGLEIRKELLEDLVGGTPGGAGLDMAAHWARQMGAQAAYWPQKVVAKAIRDNGPTYDGLPFFHSDHPVNPFIPEYGTFANDIDGTVLGAAGLGSDEPEIGPSVTVDVAVNNIQRVTAYLASIKMPNGEDPRKLRPVGMIVPPALVARAQQITNAKFIAQAAGASGGGAGDISAIVSNWGFGQPIQADELGGSFENGSNKAYYLIMAGLDRNELGAFTYVLREPFKITALTGDTDAELARTRIYQWTVAGRNTVGNGHPYLFVRVNY